MYPDGHSKWGCVLTKNNDDSQRSVKQPVSGEGPGAHGRCAQVRMGQSWPAVTGRTGRARAGAGIRARSWEAGCEGQCSGSTHCYMFAQTAVRRSPAVPTASRLCLLLPCSVSLAGLFGYLDKCCQKTQEESHHQVSSWFSHLPTSLCVLSDALQ